MNIFYTLRHIIRPLYKNAITTRLAEPIRRYITSQLDSNTSLLVEDFDADLKFICSLTEHIGSAIFWSGGYSMADLTLLNHLLTEDATFIDVGANQGVFSLFVAKRLVKGQVLAFEPEHQNLQLLAQNIKLNALTNITVIDKGLADTAKTVKIYGPLCEARDRTFNRGMASTISCGNIANHLGNIEVIALDHYVSEQNIKRVDVIKIDIEGGELSALRGMNSVLRRFGPALHIELNTPSCQAAGYLPRDILNFLQHHGYRFFEIVSTRNLLPFQNPQYFFKPFVHIHPTRNAQNIFCIKRDEHRIAISHLLKK